jgi:hypothetical protein
MEAPASWRWIVPARNLLACLTTFAAVPSTAQILFFGPNGAIEAPAPGFITGIAQDRRTAFITSFPQQTQVYARRGPLRWDLQATLVPPSAPYGFEGIADVDGDLAVGKAFLEGPINQPPNGAVVVYQRFNGVWQFTHALTAPEEHAVGFGNTINVDGDTIAISSYTGGGAVFIYRRTASGDVVLQQEIDTEATEQFAALDKGTLLVSVVDFQLPGTPYGVVVYQLTEQGAVPVQTLVPSDPIRGETFGDSLSISGDVAVIGAPFSERRGECGFMSDRFGAGNAFVFERDHDNVWEEVALLSNPDCGWFFGGGGTVTDGKRIVSSASYIGDPSGQNADSRSYFYERRRGIWTLQGALMAPTCSNGFGASSLMSNTLLAGTAGGGVLYVFSMNHLIAVSARTCNPPSSP